MKLAKIALENFRHLGTPADPLAVDFTDALGRVRDFTLLVGPNASGKTTILDAIAAALAPGLGMPALRPGIQPQSANGGPPRCTARQGHMLAPF